MGWLSDMVSGSNDDNSATNLQEALDAQQDAFQSGDQAKIEAANQAVQQAHQDFLNS